VTELSQAVRVEAVEWWKERFGVRYPESGPPFFKPRSNVYRRKSATIALPLPEDVAKEGPERQHELFLAATCGVLYRYTGGEEPEGIVVGSPLPAEDAEEDEPDALPLLLHVALDQPFSALVEAAESSIADSYERGDLDMAELLDALAMSEVQNRHPLFSVVLRVAGHHPRLGDLRNDVTITVGDELELEYNANVHEEATVARLGAHVLAFLERGLADPESQVGAIDYLGSDERRQLLEEWGSGPAAEIEETTLHDLVEAAAKRAPDQEAIVFGEETISYGELDVRANRLANHLRSLGVDRGSRVGLCIYASPDLLIGLLGVLKSGAAVVPLVPTFPPARNALVIEDSGMEVAVTESALAERFPEGGPALVQVDRDGEAIAEAPDTSPNAGAGLDDVLYVLFTSGSTGRPKGVVMEQRPLVNLVLWQRARGIDPNGRRTLQRTSIGFDVSFQEIFSTWAFGGTLVVATDEVRDDPSQLPAFIERHGISRAFLPPVALDQVAVGAALEQRSLKTLEEAIVAGEALQVSMPMRRLFHELDCRLDNQYGPTETHVVTAFELEGSSTRWPTAPPIGKPVQNVKVYVLDQGLQPVPAGVPGELWVGGAALARGYVTEEETAERFVPDQLAPAAGGRMYRTGDRARFLADGNIEFLGRADDQVKIRGYRIELGEIEANLLRIPGINQAAVAVHESDVVGKQLAAYVVTEHEGQPDGARIRELMMDWLPGHMVPAASAVVHLDELPTTPTGKVDRKALPAPPRAVASEGPAAKGDTEEMVAGIWARALGVERVGRDDNFIDLGGHSLVGIQIVSQLNEVYSIALPLRTLLRGTTVAQLADEIDRLRGVAVDADGAEAVAVDGDGAGPALQELELPNGRRIVCLQRAETEYLYLDVFDHRTYDRAGIRYPEQGVVFDVGAHVGLFTLYALDRSPGLQVYAFEPAPPLYEALRRNTDGLENVRLYPFALSNRSGSGELTFYPNLTGMTSFYPHEEQERALLSRILHNLTSLEESRGSALLAGSDEYLKERLRSSTFTAERRTLSYVLAETGVERVDLLKIDVQKAELEVLEGIAEEDWPKIAQLAIELHDLDGVLGKIESLLREKGYRVTVEQDPLHEGTVVHFVYAV
jgi:amino acid adenylation domain-containing protein/FkbM family methyltransferase